LQNDSFLRQFSYVIASSNGGDASAQNGVFLHGNLHGGAGYPKNLM
jgi:hypothetical protein